MADITTKLEVFGELMQGTLGIGIWHYGPSMNLLKTNSPCRKTYDNLFAISGCKDRILKACKSSHMPHMVMDAMGLAWIAVSCLEKGDDPNALIVLGPVFSSGYSEANLDKAIGDVQISYSLKRELINQIMLVPVVQLLTFCEYGAMLYYCLYGERIGRSGVRVISGDNRQEARKMEELKEKYRRKSYAFEQQRFKAIETGNIHYRPNLDEGSLSHVGVLCEDDPLRQAKNEIIVYIALSTRAAVRGGLPEETAYDLSDYYIQKLEASKDCAAVFQCGSDAFEDFLHRVYENNLVKGRSREIQNCMGYIELHLTDGLDFDELARELGYSRTYLSSKFRKEMGMTMNDYITKQKMELAKVWLRNTEKSVQDISFALNYGSNSYFGALFHKYTGVSPTDYRNGDGV